MFRLIPSLLHTSVRWLVSLLQPLVGCSALLRCRITHSRAVAQGLVEYALILVLIAIVAIGSLSMLGDRTSSIFEEVQCTLSGGTMHTDQGNGNSNRCR